MTFQTLQNNDENRGKTKRANLIQEIRSTWLGLAEEFQIFGYFGDQYKIEAKQDIDRIRVLLGEEDESLPFKAG